MSYFAYLSAGARSRNRFMFKIMRLKNILAFPSQNNACRKSSGDEGGIEPVLLLTLTANYNRLQLTLIISTARRTGSSLARHARYDDRRPIQAETSLRSRPRRPAALLGLRESSPSYQRAAPSYAPTRPPSPRSRAAGAPPTATRARRPTRCGPGFLSAARY